MVNPRAIHLNNLGLIEDPKPGKIEDLLSKIGYVQLDSLFVVARAHDLTIHTRLSNYSEEEIFSLISKKSAIEGLMHAKSIVPIQELPYLYRKMLDRRDQKQGSFPKGVPYDKVMNETLRQISATKELSVQDLDLSSYDLPPKGRWSGFPKRILEHLANRGYITISRRDGFGKAYYSIFEEVHGEIDPPDRMEVFWHDLYRNLKILGVTQIHRLLHYTYMHRTFNYKGKNCHPRTLVKKGIETGKIGRMRLNGRDYLFHPDFSPVDPDMGDPLVFLLNPFDNALWSRESLKEEYGFDYKMEVYVPATKRVYGFYTMPILYGTDFAGRVDVKLERAKEHFFFKKWTWEKEFQGARGFFNELAITCSRLLHFHQAKTFSLGNLKKSYVQTLVPFLESFDLTHDDSVEHPV